MAAAPLLLQFILHVIAVVWHCGIYNTSSKTNKPIVAALLGNLNRV